MPPETTLPAAAACLPAAVAAALLVSRWVCWTLAPGAPWNAWWGCRACTQGGQHHTACQSTLKVGDHVSTYVWHVRADAGVDNPPVTSLRDLLYLMVSVLLLLVLLLADEGRGQGIGCSSSSS